MRQITPCPWFDDKAEEAAKFYVSLDKNPRPGAIARSGEAEAKASRRPAGLVMTVTFQVNGQGFMDLNGRQVFTCSPALSLVMHGESQAEIDVMWENPSEGGCRKCAAC